jgi:beta-galactosidase
MNKLSLAFLGLCLAAMTCICAADFQLDGTRFTLDGKPLQIRAGEIHYARVPKDEWRNRILMAKAMGLNTISTYVFWNLHEPKKGEFDFSGDKDVAGFIKLCGELGMHAIVRPGPYVCAEWDLGGLPAWLLAEPGIQLRSTDPRFLDPAKAWMTRMGAMLQPLSVAQGGPVLVVQLENEYGFFGSDAGYLDELQRALRSGGYQGMLFTSDGASEGALRAGGRPGILKAANFGSKAESSFQALRKASPCQPDFTAEFWVGWFDQWQRPHQWIDNREKLVDLEWMMGHGASFNLYMFHGGTTRGLWTGANWEGRYRPVTCSYDYLAPLDESGRPTAKYHDFRAVIQGALKGEKLPDIPSIPSTASVGDIRLTEQCRLLDAIPAGQTSPTLQTMEDLGQSTGFILYRTTLDGPVEGELALGQVKDRVHVLMDGMLLGVSGRSTKGAAIAVKIPEGKHRLDLLVENMGRINFGKFMQDERKGLTAPVVLNGKELGPFEQVGLPMQVPPDGIYQEIKDGKTLGSATLYRGKLKIGSPRDTWLDLRRFGRGVVWFNGRNLGRYWKAGPAQGVFLPGCWMKSEGENELVVLELESETCPDKLPTSAVAIWGNGN